MRDPAALSPALARAQAGSLWHAAPAHGVRWSAARPPGRGDLWIALGRHLGGGRPSGGDPCAPAPASAIPSPLAALAPLLVLLLALLLRGAGLPAGLPHNPHPDEQAIVNRAAAFATGDLNPHRFINPALYLYLSAAASAVLFLLDLASGVVASAGAFASLFLVDPTSFYIAARLVSLAAGLATVALTTSLARALGLPRRWPWLAALLVAVTPTHANYARQAVPDATMLLLATLSLLLAQRATRDGSRRALFAAAALAGLAAATKYNAGPLLGPALLAAAFALAWRTHPGGWRAALCPALALALPAGLLALALFLALNPYLILDSTQARADFAYQAAVMGSAQPSLGLPLHLDELLSLDYGPLLLPLAALGIARCWRGGPWGTERRAQLVPLVALGSYTLVFGLSRYAPDRWWLPVLPLLAAYAAAALGWLLSLCLRGTRGVPAARVERRRAYAPVALMAVLLALLPPLAESAVRGVRAAAPDTAALATDLVERTLPPGTALVFDDGVVDPAPDAETLRARLSALQGHTSPAAQRLRLRLELLLALPPQRPTYRLIDSPASVELNTFGLGSRPEDYEYASLRARGAQYAVVSGEAVERAQRGADPWPQRAAFYRQLAAEADLIAVVPASPWRNGPEVRLYRFRSPGQIGRASC